MGVIVLDRLRDIDYVDCILPIQHVVFAQICVNQLALLIKHSHDFCDFEVDLTPSFNILDVCVFEPGSINHILPNEIHHQYI